MAECAEKTVKTETLWYTAPAKEWKEGLPVGNGRLAAMIYGDEATDIAGLNHEWLWRGKNRGRKNEEKAQYLPEIRQYLREGNFAKAGEIVNAHLAGSPKRREDSFQPAGDLNFRLLCREQDGEKIEFLCRSLNLQEGMVRTERAVSGKNGEKKICSEIFAAQGGRIFCRWRSENGEKFDARLSYTRTEDPEAEEDLDVSEDGFRFRCAFDGGLHYEAVTELETDGSAVIDGLELVIRDAACIVAETDIAVSVRDMEAELSAHPFADFDAALEAHRKIFAEYMDRVRICIHDPDAAAHAAMTTAQRIEAVRNGAADPTLSLLFADFGRYLLVSSSANCDLPANLQGKWNAEINPPWASDYHMDINLQMNYWMCEACGLAECSNALINYLLSFTESGREAAKLLYGCRGILLPLQTDVWGITTPESVGYAAWIGAGAWEAEDVWNRYAYGGDKTYLKEKAYPFFAGIAAFYEDYLVPDENGVLQIMPSQSPENRFEGGGDFPVSICISSAMDVQLCYKALTYAIDSAEILGIDAGRAARWKEIRAKLPPFAIGPDGRLLEWDRPMVEREPGHRHFSHLYGLFPGSLFTPETRPEQYEAARKSFEYRLSHGGGHTGWSRAWTACMYARLGEGEKVEEHLHAIIRDFATISLLDLHPPRIFQIDGNLGGAAALLEALMQCWDGKIHLLRALPSSWADGSVAGIFAPGGHRLDFAWKDGKLQTLSVTLGFAGRAVVEYAGKEKEITGKPGETVRVL